MQSLIKKMQQIDLTPILYNSINLYEFIDTLSMQVRFKLHRGDSELFKSELIKTAIQYSVFKSQTDFGKTEY